MAMNLQTVVLNSKTCLTDAEWRANGKPHKNTWCAYWIDDKGRRHDFNIRTVPGNQKLRTRVQVTYGMISEIYLSVGNIVESIKVKNPWTMRIIQ